MPRVVQRRGGHAEGVHPFSAVAVQDGRVVGRLGEPIISTWRSAAKPFQLRASLAALGDPELPEDELAVGSASHTAEAVHLAVVRRILARFDRQERELLCFPHAPASRERADACIREGVAAWTDIHNNCSGKHAFMLAAAAARGWALDYRPPDHPLQRDIRARLVALCAAEPGHGVDGCGVPTFALEIAGFARAWAVLAQAAVGQGDPVLGRIAGAMLGHPMLVSGTDRLDRAVTRGAQEPLIIKIGAQALHCMALPDRRLGIVVKVHTGDESALASATRTALETFAPGAFERPDDWDRETVRNVAGVPVGDWIVAL